eukprot:3023226-Lingulodinium_polyedra.AAC.1
MVVSMVTEAVEVSTAVLPAPLSAATSSEFQAEIVRLRAMVAAQELQQSADQQRLEELQSVSVEAVAHARGTAVHAEARA